MWKLPTPPGCAAAFIVAIDISWDPTVLTPLDLGQTPLYSIWGWLPWPISVCRDRVGWASRDRAWEHSIKPWPISDSCRDRSRDLWLVVVTEERMYLSNIGRPNTRTKLHSHQLHNHLLYTWYEGHYPWWVLVTARRRIPRGAYWMARVLDANIHPYTGAPPLAWRLHGFGVLECLIEWGDERPTHPRTTSISLYTYALSTQWKGLAWTTSGSCFLITPIILQPRPRQQQNLYNR